MSIYYTTKAFVLHFSEGLHEELKEKNILVSTLCPDATETEFFKRAKLENKFISQNPIMMSSKEVAEITYSELMRNKAIIIPGFMNKFGAISVRFMPRSLTRKLTMKINNS